ncbi:Ig-like domain-containing protein [Nocardioides sp. LHD-245]|uniref:Ig-like domain-containing protein n=1 Tax=Nocardioides sp. LHD-245 TaxID=3051387 RepID=UPI0027E07A77|nr:Ig-like domain-containing protein [Nocardioides sp. LHD-245]
MKKSLHVTLSGLIAATGTLVAVGLGAAVAPTAQAAPTQPCGPLGSSGYVVSAVATGLSAPVSVAVDAGGSVFVGERTSGHVEKFTPSGGGYANTKLPDSFNVPYGVAVDATGNVWVTNSSGNHLVRMLWNGSTYQPQTPSPDGIYVPGDVAVDSSGGAYIASAVSGTMSGVPSGRQILKLSPTAPWTTSVVRDTTGDTWGVAVGPDGSVYNTEHPDNVVRSRWASGSWSSVTIPSTGLSSPQGLAVDAGGTVYVADTGNDRIVSFVPSGPSSWNQVVLPIGGLGAPLDVAAADDGVVYVADTDNNRVLKAAPVTVDATADTASTTLGNAVITDVRSNDDATGATLADPTIAKNPKHGTATVNADGTITYTPAAGFSGTDTYSYAVGDNGSPASVCATATVTVKVTQGNACDPVGTTGEGTRLRIETGVSDPNYFDVDADGSIFVTDYAEKEVIKLTPSASGYDRTVVATGVDNARAIAIGEDGTLWVTGFLGRLLKLTPSGAGYTIADTYTGGLLSGLGGVDVGPDGNVYVSINSTSSSSAGVLRLEPGSGMAQTQVASGLHFAGQVDVAEDGAVYVASRSRVVKAVDNGAGWTQTDAVTGFPTGTTAEGVEVDDTGTVWIAAGDAGVFRATPSGSGYSAPQPYAPWTGDEYTLTVITDADDTVYVSSSEDLWFFDETTLRASDDTATTSSPRPVTTDVRANDTSNVRLSDEPTVLSAPAHGTTTVNDDGTITYTPDAGWHGTDTYRYRIGDDNDGDPSRVCDIATVTVAVTSPTGCGLLPTSAYTSRSTVISNLREPNGIVSDANNTIWLADSGYAMVATAWGPGYTPNTIDGTGGIDPQGIAMDSVGAVYYADEGEHEIVKLTRTGYTWARTVLATDLQRPSGVAVDADGNVYFSENSSGDVHKLTPSGGSYTSSLVGSGLERPRGVAVDADGNVFVADWADEDKIVRLSPSGATYTRSVVALGLDNPYGVAVQPDGTLLVGDSGNNRVLRLIPNGSGYDQETLTVWGSSSPRWIATMPSGDLLVTDQDAKTIVRLGRVSITAADDTASVPAPMSVFTAVRANDAKTPASPAMSLPTVVGSPANGAANVAGDGRIVYAPAHGFSGLDIVRYRVTDDETSPHVCAAADLRVTVQNVFMPGTVSTPQNTPVTTPLSGLASTNGAPLATDHIWSMGNPQHGSIAIYDVPWDRPIRVDYLPDPGYSGPDSYTLNLCDQSEPQQCADVAVQVTVGTNTVTAVDDSVVTDAATPVTTDVTGNDISASAQDLAAPTVTSAPAHGDTSVGAGGITYTPAAGFSGGDSYEYQVCDTSTPTPVCDTARVAVTVSAPPGPTTAPTISVTAPAKATLKVTRSGRAKPLALTGQVSITGLHARRTTAGTATLYGPARKPSAATCTPADAVGTVSFTPGNGSIPLPVVTVTRPGYYTWVATTSADSRNLAATQSCGAAGATTLVHRPDLGRVEVSTGYSGVRADGSTAARRIRPVKVSVPAVGLRAKVETVGMRKGSMRIPTDVSKGGWLNGSAAPGETVGSTVIAGHVSDRGDRPGAFGKLRRARPGQVITVRTATGTAQRYRIATITAQPRAKGLGGATVSTTGEHQLTLVTCTGRVTYRNGRFHYTKNLVVTATPIG